MARHRIFQNFVLRKGDLLVCEILGGNGCLNIQSLPIEFWLLTFLFVIRLFSSLAIVEGCFGVVRVSKSAG